MEYEMTRTIPATPASEALPFTFRYADTEDYGIKVTAAINAQITVAGNAIAKLGDMIVTAYAENVQDLMGYDSWAEYVSAELHFDGFKPDTPARDFLISMFREAGMQFTEVAQVVKASVRTVKTVAEKQGTTAKRTPKTAARKPAAGVTTVTVSDAAQVAALHKVMDGMTSGQLEDLAQYIGTILRQRNAATVRKAA
jgi:hypothetical protein